MPTARWKPPSVRLPRSLHSQRSRRLPLQCGAVILSNNIVPSFSYCYSTSSRHAPSPHSHRASDSKRGTTTPTPSSTTTSQLRLPFYFESGYAGFAKRAPKPFPPPFTSRPSGSFSDPLSTHHRSRDSRRSRASYYHGDMIRGVTNGDDAMIASEYFVGANDGVGAWATRERGHAALWSRLLLHFMAVEAEQDGYGAPGSCGKEGETHGGGNEPDPVGYLQRAYERTLEATSKAESEWFGTTTASSALLWSSAAETRGPLLYVTQLGDSQVLVIRPREKKVVFRTAEQWHWFDCPRQLGTNSPDRPEVNAVVDRVEVEEGDLVIASSDGVGDNLWEHEVVERALESLEKWEQKTDGLEEEEEEGDRRPDRMQYVAEEIVHAARLIAEDPFAESPYMEKAVDEGLGIEGGKLDDISVVAALCRRRTT